MPWCRIFDMMELSPTGLRNISPDIPYPGGPVALETPVVTIKALGSAYIQPWNKSVKWDLPPAGNARM
jgi:hypothetical protein